MTLAGTGQGCLVIVWQWTGLERTALILLGNDESLAFLLGFLDPTPGVKGKMVSHYSLELGAGWKWAGADCLKVFFLARLPFSLCFGLKEQELGGF